MGRMKGFYFSLDALTASMVLLATVGMISSYSPQPDTGNKPTQLDQLHTAVEQKVSEWNSSLKSDNTVLGYIYSKYYEESASSARQTCQNYFKTTRSYALFIVNETERIRVCGNLDISKESEIAVRETFVPDIPVNSKLRGPYKAVMVMKN